MGRQQGKREVQLSERSYIMLLLGGCRCNELPVMRREVEGYPAHSRYSVNVSWILYILLVFLIKRAQDEGGRFVCGFVVLLIWCFFLVSSWEQSSFSIFQAANACLMLPGGISWPGHWRGYFKTDVPRKMYYHLMVLLSFILLCSDFWWFLQEMWDQGWSESCGIASVGNLERLAEGGGGETLPKHHGIYQVA